LQELEALNYLLKTVGADSVDSINSLHPQAESAKEWLDTTRQQTLGNVWWFNREKTCYLDVNGLIEGYVPLSVIPYDKNMIYRSTGFRDNLNHENKAFADVLCEYVSFDLPWIEIPETIQHLIKIKAAIEFVRAEINDESIIRTLEKILIAASVAASSMNIRQLRINKMDSPRPGRVMHRVKPWWRPRN